MGSISVKLPYMETYVIGDSKIIVKNFTDFVSNSEKVDLRNNEMETKDKD